MYIRLKDNKFQQIISEAIKKAGSYEKLAKEIGICRQKVWYYKTKNVALKEERLNLILKFMNIKLENEDIEKKFPDNWRQIIGGNNCVKKKISDGTLNQQLRQSRKNIKHTLGDWHREMKKKDVKAYYLSQYDKFKKIAGYKFITENGEKVRNKFEKEVADILKQNKIVYQYEPLVNIGKNYFFPDFLINNKIIIECTMWRGSDKALKLKEKINKLKKEFVVYVVIPKKLNKYYQPVKDNLILGLDNFKRFTKTLI